MKLKKIYIIIISSLFLYSCAEYKINKAEKIIEKNSISNTEKINLDLLKKLNIINKNSKKLKILGSGEIKNKVIIEANFFSKSAKDKLEKTGGTVQILT